MNSKKLAAILLTVAGVSSFALPNISVNKNKDSKRPVQIYYIAKQEAITPPSFNERYLKSEYSRKI